LVKPIVSVNRMKVALLIESSRGYGRGLLNGIAQYARSQDKWSIYHNERCLSDDSPTWLRKGCFDGVIVRAESRSLVEALEQLDVPVVDLRGLYDIDGAPCIISDDRRAVEMAVRHLWESGFREFAYCGFEGVDFSQTRKDGVVRSAVALGCEVQVYKKHQRYTTEAAFVCKSLVREEPSLRRWLNSLRTPVGLIACNDLRAQEVCTVCKDIDIRVPEEISIVGIDNDETICLLCDPPLTSVELDTRLIGYRAAQTLDAMMRKESVDIAWHLVNPRGVVVRESTDNCLVSDKLVALSMMYIKDFACKGITVEDVVKQVPVGRSTLQRRFSSTLGITIKSEIERIRIRRAKQLLLETDHKLMVIAAMTGFSHKEHMNSVFKSNTGLTPGAYRRIRGGKD
jgi:LacI family transcriptional regulator